MYNNYGTVIYHVRFDKLEKSVQDNIISKIKKDIENTPFQIAEEDKETKQTKFEDMINQHEKELNDIRILLDQLTGRAKV